MQYLRLSLLHSREERVTLLSHQQCPGHSDPHFSDREREPQMMRNRRDVAANPDPLFSLSYVRCVSLRLACSRKVYAFKPVSPCSLILTLGGTLLHPVFLKK